MISAFSGTFSAEICGEFAFTNGRHSILIDPDRFFTISVRTSGRLQSTKSSKLFGMWDLSPIRNLMYDVIRVLCGTDQLSKVFTSLINQLLVKLN
jgi:hypothetical protein